MSIDILLIHPPVVRPSEPPLGIATLAGFLRPLGLDVELLDLNVEAFDRLLRPGEPPSEDMEPFSRRALKKLPAAVREIRSPEILHHPSRYRSAVSHMERVLWLRSGSERGPRVTFTDFVHPRLSPLRPRDLREMALQREAGCLQEFMEERAAQRVRELQPRWVGISIDYLSQALPAMALAGVLRKSFPRLGIVVGGSLLAAWGNRLERDHLWPWVDRWIAGPGEIPLAHLLGCEVRPPARLSPPDFQGLPWHLYLSPERIVPLATARGCYWGRCRFCPEAACGSPFETMSPRDLTRSMGEALERNGGRWIHFTDNALSPRTLTALATGRTGARWFGFARFESRLMDRWFVRDLHRAGCRMLQLGLESGSQRLLDAMNKSIRLEEASRILETLHGEGIGTYVYVMFGIPGESLEDARLTLAFVADHAHCIDHLNCAILNLPRGAKGTEGLETFPFPGEEEDLSLYVDFRHREGLDRKAARRFLEREFKRHPAVASIVRRDPPAFTSSHAALFLQPHFFS